jgi:DNA repair exonuclease SbcCD ATPase subunit
MQSSEPSSPASIDLQAPLHQEIKDLKTKLSEVNANFTYYEDSNERLENLVDDQITLLERKDAEIARLTAFINTTTTQYEETASENVKLRRQSSTYEKIVEANAVELKNVAGLETTIEDREAEVRQFSIDLAAYAQNVMIKSQKSGGWKVILQN